ncbi:unnamed protein product, partial [Anisakis simplex]|uniref:DUF7083 domain-containing protein n=1 Tax=Anisakis simplex TaxID=6269 RepID=A0A0M3JGM2_ANISI
MASNEQLQTLLKGQQKLQEQIIQMLQQQQIQTPSLNVESLMDTLSRSISEFTYDPENGVTFDAWYARYTDIFTVDASKLDQSARVRLLLRKLNTTEHDKYLSFILPKVPNQLDFDETINILKKVFGAQTSLFNVRYNCLKITKAPDEDIMTFTSTVNRECERFRLGDLTSDQFKSLIFVSGLQAPEDAEYRIRLLSRIETDKTVTIQDLAEEYTRLTNLKRDAKLVEDQGTTDGSSILAVKSKNNGSKRNPAIHA